MSNYAAGNRFSDALAHFRHSMGLTGTTVNWSQWGEVGICADIDIPGLKVFSNLQALNGLGYALKTNQVQVTVANFDSFPRFSNLFPLTRNYVPENEWNAGNDA
ncbi:Erythronolide synthase, modules 1 and 2 [Orchesella cincta]|uniref:Erythronolide synthase, modules 1 and 2 n=1 Tax=Orchesella cincta TaxID=48709 RepID=A0A1D2MH75_ORCCI|nr:Erythronolide synthase, modules 1 and 2 [Orchesella cincta]